MMASPDIRLWLVVLASMALAPFVVMMVTSFVKLVIVGSIIRTAIGTPQIPPTMVITGLAMILTVHVMWPMGSAIYRDYEILTKAEVVGPSANQTQNKSNGEPASREPLGTLASRVLRAAHPHIKRFLNRHSHAENIALFKQLQAKLGAAYAGDNSAVAYRDVLPPATDGGGIDWRELIDDVTILVPAFVLSELTEAFQIGFLIFVPFVIIDLVVSNLLLTMGMIMLQPTTISLPLKILLFVLIDGWHLIIQGVILGYA